MSAIHVTSVLDSLYHSAKSRGDMPQAEALSEAMDYAGRWVPKKVEKPGEWDAAKCPTCGESLSNHQGDGYYTHSTWMEYCPNDECHQKLEWWK